MLQELHASDFAWHVETKSKIARHLKKITIGCMTKKLYEKFNKFWKLCCITITQKRKFNFWQSIITI